jgi:acyl-CoA hydrolase
MHFAVDVLARDLARGEQRLATSCVIVFVALDGPEGKPTDVPAWEPRDDTERSLQDYARRLIEVSRRMQEEVGGMRPPLHADGGHD